MKKNILIFLLLIVINNLNAQSYMNGMANSGPLKIFTKAKTPEKYTGSPYINDLFLPTIIDDGERSLEAFARYNSVEDVVEIKVQKNSDEINVLPKLKAIKYRLLDYTIFIDNFKNTEGETIDGYMFEYFSDSGLRFLARPLPDVIPAKEARSGYEESRPAHLDVNMSYYIQKDGGRLKEVRLKEKDFKSIFSDKGKMDAYFKENKIKDEQDVVEMLRFYSE